MTHDPLCPYFPEQQGFGGIDSGVPSTQPYIAGIPCQCDLIARVREDERGRLAALLDEDEHVGPVLLRGDGCRYCSACGKALTRQQDRCAVAAIEALGGQP